jgi:hypothetical protein
MLARVRGSHSTRTLRKSTTVRGLDRGFNNAEEQPETRQTGIEHCVLDVLQVYPQLRNDVIVEMAAVERKRRITRQNEFNISSTVHETLDWSTAPTCCGTWRCKTTHKRAVKLVVEIINFIIWRCDW